MIVNHLLFLIAAVLLAVASLLIARRVRNRHRFDAASTDRELSEKFLFFAIRPRSAVVSNVGALISFYVMVIGAVLVTLGWGTILLISVIAGVAATIVLQWWRMRSFYPNVRDGDLTYVDRIQRECGSSHARFAVALMAIFAVSTIGSEVMSVKLLYSAFSTPPEPLVRGEMADMAFNLNIFLFLCCALYVYYGGYLAVVRTDYMQLFLIFLAWAAAATHLVVHADLGALIVRHFVLAWQPVVVGIATAMLIFGYGLSSLDAWIRTVGLMHRQFGPKGPRAVDRIMAGTLVLSVLVVSVPALIGLQLRDEIGGALGCPSGAQFVIKGQPALDYVAASKPLERDAAGACQLLPAPPQGGQDDFYARFTAFTNAPYILASLATQNAAASIADNGDVVLFAVAFVAAIAGLLSATLTTVDSLLLLIAQLVHQMWTHGRRHERQCTPPSRAIIGATTAMLLFSVVPLLSSKFYLSVGIFAWSAMLFLGAVCLSATGRATGPALNARLDAIAIAFALWCGLSVVPHLAAAVGVVDVAVVRHHLGPFVAWLFTRSAMVLSAFCLIVAALAVTAVRGRHGVRP